MTPPTAGDPAGRGLQRAGGRADDYLRGRCRSRDGDVGQRLLQSEQTGGYRRPFHGDTASRRFGHISRSATLAAHEFAQARAATLHDVALRKRIRARVAAFCAKRK